jgi:DNA-binding response OmpR family regulator
MHRHKDVATILIVEDDAVLGQVLARVLTRERQTALHVPNMSQALRLVKSRWPRLVLLDTGLRDGTALKVAESIRALCAGLPFIFLTAYPRHKSAFPDWVDRLVTKSIDLPDLRRTVDAVLAEGRPSLESDPVDTLFLPNVAGSRQDATNVNR